MSCKVDWDQIDAKHEQMHAVFYRILNYSQHVLLQFVSNKMPALQTCGEEMFTIICKTNSYNIHLGCRLVAPDKN